MSKVQYEVFDDATGGMKLATRDEFEYFVEEFSRYRNDNYGNTYDKEQTNIRKLPIRETVQAYNPQGVLIAQKF